MKNVLKNVWYYAWLPFLLLFGIIYYLANKLNAVGYKLEQAKAEKKLGDAMNRIQEKKEYADAKETEFNSDYNAYRAARDELERSKRDGSPS